MSAGVGSIISGRRSVLRGAFGLFDATHADIVVVQAMAGNDRQFLDDIGILRVAHVHDVVFGALQCIRYNLRRGRTSPLGGD